MIYLHRLIEALIIPPSSSLILILLGLLFLGRKKWFSRTLLSLGVVSLYLTSILVVVGPLTQYWVSLYPMVDLEQQDAQAIVVLGGGRRKNAKEYGGDTTSRFAMERLRYAARLHRETGLPILVTGGRVYNEEISEAELMTVYLEEMGVSPRWQEDQSKTTFENAQYSAPILKAADMKRVLLVTHGLHMPRSVWAFEKMDVEVIPAPTVFHSYKLGGIKDFIPEAGNEEDFARFMHEWMGLVWYKLSKS